MRMKRIQKLFWIHFILFFIAFIINLIWEYLHSAFYTTIMKHDILGFLSMASADGLLVLTIYWIVCLETRDFFWFAKLRKHIVLIIVSGIFLSFFIEIKNMYFTSVWSYTATMPILPILHVGASPVFQMIITPLLTFSLAQCFYTSKH